MLALAAVFTVAASALLFRFVLGSALAAFFAIAVVACSILLGLASGIFAAAASAAAIVLFFLPQSFAGQRETEGFRLAIGFCVLAVATHMWTRYLSARIRRQAKPPLGMHGRVDGLVDGELYGWAFDADHPEAPVLLDVYVNRHPAAQLAAVHYRPDVEQLLDCSGRHGFYLDLASSLPPETEMQIEVRLPNGVPLANSPLRVPTPRLLERKERPTILFMHIAKTAGTAFREAIAANFLQSEIGYLYPTPPGFLVTDLQQLPLEQRRALRVVIGHFQVGMHEALPQRSEYITLVREPTARLWSQYAYALQVEPEILATESGQPLSLAELLEKRLTVNFDNVLVRCFGGIDERECPPGAITQDFYERAVECLRLYFRFVGHQEAADRSFAWLSQYYGWAPTTLLAPVNQGTHTSRFTLDAKTREAIGHYNAWDFRLYREILQRFPL